MSRTGLISAVRTEPTPSRLTTPKNTPKATPVLRARASPLPAIPKLNLPSATAMKEAEELLSMSPHAIEDLDPLEGTATAIRSARQSM